MVTYERWQQAQILERKAHTYQKEKAINNYKQTYMQYFSYLDMQPDQQNNKILEIGCADIPALYFCHNYQGFIIEPMESPILNELCQEKHINLIQDMAETCKWPADIDEIWLFNVLQHVMTPNIIVNRAKTDAKKIRFFEPINTAITTEHLHGFTFAYFKN